MSWSVVVYGATGPGEVPGIEQIGADVELRFARDPRELREAMPGAQALLGWDFARGGLGEAWAAADALRWVHWSGAGVDAALFPALVESDVVLTSSRGVFDQAMAEYVCGLVLAFAKRFPETFALQRKREWRWRMTERIAGGEALVIGAGSIGGAIARALRPLGLRVHGVARRARTRDADFDEVHGVERLEEALPGADYVIVAAPLTDATRGLLDRRRLRLMKPTARLINVGRGPIVDEAALVEALRDGALAGAALDVFDAEPLDPGSPLWTLPGVIVSPHMSGDFIGWEQDIMSLFLDNVRRFRAGEPLVNVVDKARGYVARDQPDAEHAPVRGES
jgi:phosphoglycerate dehydrogenase-like enzyme